MITANHFWKSFKRNISFNMKTKQLN